MDVRERERLALSESTPATAALHRLAAEDDEWSVSEAAEEALSQRREDALGW